MSTQLPIETRNQIIESIRSIMNAATVEIRSGSQPATADLPATGTVLAVLTFANPCSPPATNGSILMSPIGEEDSALSTAVATWARVKKFGVTVMDVDVGVSGSGATMELNTVNIVAGGPVRITSFRVTAPAG